MYRFIILIGIFLFGSSCNQHTKILEKNNKDFTTSSYQEKPFQFKWKIEKNSITKIPINIQKKLKNICYNHNRVVLIKIKTYTDDTALGTFDCRL